MWYLQTGTVEGVNGVLDESRWAASYMMDERQNNVFHEIKYDRQ